MKLIFIFLLLPFLTFSQSLNKRLKTENSIVVLENIDNILPIKNLENRSFSVFCDNNSYNYFNNSIERYDDIENNFNKNDILFLLFDNNSKIENYNQFFKYKNIIIISLNSKNIFSELENFKNIKSLIYCNSNDSLTLDYCGQLIFGGFGASGVLNQDINDKYKKFYGLQTIGGIRFKYTTPSELELDSNFIYSKIDSIVNQAIDTMAFPGCQIFVAVNQKVIFNKSYGFFTYDSIQKVTNRSMYDLASVTKVSASAPALMKLSELKKFDINNNFSKYWKKAENFELGNVSMKYILCHQAGLVAWIPFWKKTINKNGNFNDKFITIAQNKRFSKNIANNLYIDKNYKKVIFNTILDTALVNKNKYVYSDLSFYFYPEIIEKATGKDFYEFLKINFYNRLGANTLVFNPLDYFELLQIVPTEFDKTFRKQLLHGYVHDEGAALMGGVSGHAGLFGSANDLAKLFQMFLNYGEYGGEQLIDSNIVKQWTSYQLRELNNRRALVFDKPLLQNPEKGTASKDASELSFGHTGFTGTFVWADPDNGLLIVFLCNRVYPTRSNNLLSKLNIRTNIHQVFYDALKKQK